MKIKAWGWLMAGVAALGLNGFYQDGGLACLHRAVNCVESRSAAVLALASGHVDQFLEQAQIASTADDSAPVQLDGQLARVQYEVARSRGEFARVQAISAREQAVIARIEAKRAQIEARVAHRSCVRASNVTVDPVVIRSFQVPGINLPVITVPMTNVPSVNVPQIRVSAIRIPEIEVPAVNVPRIHVPTCPHVRVRVPSVPNIRIPVVHVDPSDAGPV